MSLLFVVHRCPAVPMAPKTAALTASDKSAFSVIIIALFPPNSKRHFPNRFPTATATFLPIAVEPVAEIKETRVSFVMISPKVPSPIIKLEIPSGKLFFLKTLATIFWQAMAHNGVFSDGFQIHTFPHTQAKAVFQLQTATGKLNADIIPTIPKG